MEPFRLTNRLRVALSLALAALLATALIGPKGLRLETFPADQDDAHSLPASTVAALPTAPPPWAGSLLAAIVQDGANQAIALVDVDGKASPRLLVDSFEQIGRLAWSPDGATLAFAGRKDGNWDLFRVGREGTALQRLTEHPAFDDWPAWSPDGRQLAFTSYRDGELAVYRMTADTGGSGGAGNEAEAARISGGDGPAVEPTWSPDGRWLLFAQWHDGAYRLMAIPAAVLPTDAAAMVVQEPAAGADLRAPAFEPGGEELSYVERKYGAGQLIRRPWASTAVTQTSGTVAVGFGIASHGWFPGGGAVATLSLERGGRQLEIRDTAAYGSRRLGVAGLAGDHIGWTPGPMPAGLALLEAAAPVSRASADPEGSPGLVSLPDVNVGGARINAALAEDFAALRAEVRAAVGKDFLGTLSDMWRPLAFKSQGSAFFSWHKTGRAFDTQMEMRGPGGRRDLVLLREDVGGRTMWRVFLRSAAQDGSVGRPLTEPGWSFAAGSGDPELTPEGGRRGTAMPSGYWVDFTALAERYGWRRIPSLTQSNLDWRRDWEAIEYWHFERREGLSWYAAIRQVYDHAHIVLQLDPERLRELNISFARLARMGFPAGWPGEG